MTTVHARPWPAVRVPLFVALGALFWLLAALTFRLLGPDVLAPGTPLVPVIFVLALPVAWAFLWAGKTLGRVRGAQVLPAATLMCATAIMLDGLALTFFPGLYGLPTASLLLVAALLLWGVGLILVLAFAESQRAT